MSTGSVFMLALSFTASLAGITQAILGQRGYASVWSLFAFVVLIVWRLSLWIDSRLAERDGGVG